MILWMVVEMLWQEDLNLPLPMSRHAYDQMFSTAIIACESNITHEAGTAYWNATWTDLWIVGVGDVK